MSDFTPGVGGYEAWAAAGKPTGPKPTGNDWWQKNVGSKSTKKSKTTGKSPYDTAVASLVSSIVKSATDNANKATKVQTEASNKVIADQNKQTNTTPEEAQKSQDEQFKNLVKGLQAARINQTLSPDRGGNAPWGVDTPNVPLPGGLSKDQLALAGILSAIAPGTRFSVSGGDVGPKDQSSPDQAEASSLTGTTPYVPPSGPAMGGTAPTPKVAAAEKTMATTQEKIDAAKQATHSGFNWLNPKDYLGEAVNEVAKVSHTGLQTLGDYWDVVGRGGNAVRSGLDPVAKTVGNVISNAWYERKFDPSAPPVDQVPQFIPDPNGTPGQPTQMIPNPAYTQEAEKANKAAVANAAQNPIESAWAGLLGKKNVTGTQLLQDIHAPNIPVVTPIAGMGIEMLTDPTSYVGGPGAGIKAAGEEFGLKVAPKAIEDLTNTALGKAVQTGTLKFTSAKTSQWAENQAKKVTKKVAANGGVVSGVGTAHDTLANDLYNNAIKAGASIPDAIAATRMGMVNQFLSERAEQTMATAMKSAIAKNRHQVDVQIFGKSTNLGKNPIIDAPYQLLHKAHVKASDSAVGQAIAGAFSTKHWFPGDTMTLHNKANSMGVYDFMKKAGEVREMFKGLTSDERKRIASTYERGISLAGQTAKNGKDLGDFQKYMDQINAELYAERANILGKAGDEVPNHLFHFYNGGSPEKIREARATAKTRLHAGATGEDRFTLAEAKAEGLRPTEKADSILIQQLADHQRQMVTESFHRMMTDNYGKWTDNPVTARALGLVKVTPPKSAHAVKGMSLYMDPKIKKVYDSIGKVGARDSEEANRITRYFDKIMRTWKLGNTSLRPGHHIRNMISDVYMNYLDDVRNPYKYQQGMQMIKGDRSKIRATVGNMVIDGDKIADLERRSGMSQGFISAELAEGRNPLAHGLNEFSQNREMFVRHAHFIDALEKEGKRMNLGANNTAGLYKAATAAAKRVNKYNIDYSDLTPFERDYMKRLVPFYTWSRKALPLMIETAATNPKKIVQVARINSAISQMAGQDPNDTSPIPIPDWLKNEGIARIGGGSQPNLLSLPFPTQDLGKWFGSGTRQGVLQEGLGQINPALQLLLEQATGKSTYTGANLPADQGEYARSKMEVAANLWELMGWGKNPGDLMSKINAVTGVGTYKDNEQRQLSELKRQGTSLQTQMSQINKSLGNYEVHKLKYGYSVYDKVAKKTLKSGFSDPGDALVYAIGLQKQNGKQNDELNKAMADAGVTP